MTSDVGVDQIVERTYHLHRSCGATMITTEKAATCNDCGGIVQARRHRRHHQRWPTELLLLLAQEVLPIVGGLLIFVLLCVLLGPGWAVFVSSLAVLTLSVRRIRTPHRLWHHNEDLDYNNQFRWFGRLTLLLAAFLALGFVVPGKRYQEWAVLANTPKPRDCDWTSTPFGNKHCHYEPIFRNVVNQNGEDITVKWER